MQKNVMELVGAYFLVLAIGLGGGPAAIGLMLMGMVYAGGHVSGAHYNPAVSFGILLRGKMKTNEAALYMIAQIAGAVMAAFTVQVMLGKTFAPAPDPRMGTGAAIALEALCTFVLAFVVLNIACSKKTAGNHIYGFAIGLTVTGLALGAGPLTGGAFNPAVGIGPGLVSTLYGSYNISNMLIYIIGPMVGGAGAAIMHQYTDPDEA
jgi:aquaporin Z